MVEAGFLLVEVNFRTIKSEKVETYIENCKKTY